MKIKKTSVFIFTMIFIIAGFHTVSADDLNSDKVPYINAKCAIAMDSTTKIPLLEKSSHNTVPIASTTKIMTILVALKYGDLNKLIEISGKAAGIRGSTVGYRKGERISLKELLYGLMLRSGNDAAIAISEGMCGSVDEFVNLMNEYAVSLGLANTHFESPHGLDSLNHYSTAYDLAYLTCIAKQYDLFNDIVSSKDIEASKYGFTRSYHNINKILWQLQGANGVKTGFTGGAGKCLVTSVDVKGHDVVIVVLNSTPRWKETTKIYDYVVKNYEYKKIIAKDQRMGEIFTSRGVIKLQSRSDIVLPVKGCDNLRVVIKKPSKIDSTVNKGDNIGKVSVYCDEKLLINSPLIAGNTVKVYELNPFKWFKQIVNN